MLRHVRSALLGAFPSLTIPFSSAVFCCACLRACHMPLFSLFFFFYYQQHRNPLLCRRYLPFPSDCWPFIFVEGAIPTTRIATGVCACSGKTPKRACTSATTTITEEKQISAVQRLFFFFLTAYSFFPLRLVPEVPRSGCVCSLSLLLRVSCLLLFSSFFFRFNIAAEEKTLLFILL